MVVVPSTLLLQPEMMEYLKVLEMTGGFADPGRNLNRPLSNCR